MRLRLLCAFMLACTLGAAWAQDPDLPARIQRVESGLVGPVPIKGERAWTIAERMDVYGVPGVSVAVFKDGAIQWAKGYGVKDVETKEPVDAATLFIAGSVSKPVAAMGALRLVQEGKLELDRNINRFLKSWKLPDNEFTAVQKVTLRRLLSHSAGTTVHGFRGYAPGDELPSLLQILDGQAPAISAPIRVDIEPGSKWRYSGGGITIVQQAMIDVSGAEFPVLMERLVLDRLGMSASSYEQELTPERLGLAASGHTAQGAPVAGKRYRYPEMAAAGLWTTPSDLARFAIELGLSAQGKSNKVLNKEMSRLMVSPQIAVSGDQNMALGLFLDKKDRYFQHGGADIGFMCALTASVEGGYGAVVMTNSDSPGGLIQEILRSIAKEYGWEEYLAPERELITLEPEELEILAGRYRLGSDDLVTLSLVGGRLMGSAIAQSTFQLLASSEGLFIRRDADVTYVFSKFVEGIPHQITIRTSTGERHGNRMSAEEFVPLEHLMKGAYGQALEAYMALRQADSTDEAVSESRLNELGYRLMRLGNLERAIDLFRVNIELHPASFNAYDRLGEAYMTRGDKEQAIESYEASVRLNPANANGLRMLEKLKKG